MSGPYLVAIEHDAQFRSALERDLGDAYSGRYEVLTAPSEESGVALLRSLRVRGASVVLILASQRMPSIGGVAVLAASRALFPAARRLLLTGSAEPGSLDPAITQADIHHYVPKPWDPPEHRLFPAIDELLPPVPPPSSRPTTRVIGEQASTSTLEVRRLLARNLVAHEWLDVDSNRDAAEIVDVLEVGRSSLPVVVLENGEVLHAPTPRDVAVAVGLHVTPRLAEYDVIVVGGGPAGLAAAIGAASEGFSTIVLESRSLGGQISATSSIRNYVGFPAGVSGAELVTRARDQALGFGAELVVLADVIGLRGAERATRVRLKDDTEVTGSAVILAAGITYRQLGIPGLDRLVDRGVYYGQELGLEELFAHGQDVYVLGAGNGAGQAALKVSQSAASVTLLVRGSSLAASMSDYLISALEVSGKVQIEFSVELVGCGGHDRLESLRLRNREDGEEREVPADALLVLVSGRPCTKWLEQTVELDASGYVLTAADLSRAEHGSPQDRWLLPFETSLPGVFAVGDVRSGSIKRIASAVGEGSNCIASVHRWRQSS